jgi:hypothetical protein
VSIEEQLERGARAKHVLDNPVFQEAFASVRQAILDKWENAPLSDREGKHELHLMLKLLNDVRGNLELALADGNMAADKLKHLNRDQTFAEWRASYM